MPTFVKTQSELDAAIEAGAERIIIGSPSGVWLRIGGSATVEAWDSATVEAWDSATVTARGSATVEAWDSATVTARDSATVTARGSATVEAWGSATVEAWDSATVTARDSATVTARGSATVTARDSATVTASKYTAVRLHSTHATVQGGVIIDVTALDLTDLTTWAEYHGVDIIDEEAIVYKAVNNNLESGRGFPYPVGETVTCPDWSPVDKCGSGLHFSPSPSQAREYYSAATRFLRCAVPTAALPIDGDATYTTPKLKAPTARVLAEVDIHGKDLT